MFNFSKIPKKHYPKDIRLAIEFGKTHLCHSCPVFSGKGMKQKKPRRDLTKALDAPPIPNL